MQPLDEEHHAVDPGLARGVAAFVALTLACTLLVPTAGAATARTETAAAAAAVEFSARSTASDVAAVMLLVSGLVAFAYARRRSGESRRGRARPQSPATRRRGLDRDRRHAERRGPRPRRPGDADVEPAVEARPAAGDRAPDHRSGAAADRALA